MALLAARLGMGQAIVTSAPIRQCRRCDEPITGVPVTVGNDPLDRVYCSEGCRDSDAEGAYEQGYQPGVAT